MNALVYAAVGSFAIGALVSFLHQLKKKVEAETTAMEEVQP